MNYRRAKKKFKKQYGCAAEDLAFDLDRCIKQLNEDAKLAALKICEALMEFSEKAKNWKWPKIAEESIEKISEDA